MVNSLNKEVLTLTEAAEYMGMSKNYLYRLTSARQIPHYKPNGKMIYFDKNDLILWLKSNPVHTEEQLNNMARVYCLGRS